MLFVGLALVLNGAIYAGKVATRGETTYRDARVGYARNVTNPLTWW